LGRSVGEKKSIRKRTRDPSLCIGKKNKYNGRSLLSASKKVPGGHAEERGSTDTKIRQKVFLL